MTTTTITIKPRRKRRTRAEIAEDDAQARLAASFAALVPAAETYLARTTPGQRHVGARIASRVGATPKYRWSR
jgi:hypothetical protein